MKKMLLMTVGFAALGIAPAVAADLAPRTYTKAPVAVAPLPTWAGLYVGAMGGFGKETVGDTPVNGFFGGGTVGYNWQIDRYVFGIEADAAASDINATTNDFDPQTGIAFSSDAKVHSLGTVRGRFGVTFDQVLLYGTGGFAWADTQLGLSIPDLGVSLSDSKFLTGYAIGAGMEVMFAPHWSLKAEYLYRSFGGQTFFSGTAFQGVSNRLNINSVQAGVNYHF